MYFYKTIYSTRAFKERDTVLTFEASEKNTKLMYLRLVSSLTGRHSVTAVCPQEKVLWVWAVVTSEVLRGVKQPGLIDFGQETSAGG